MNIHTYTKMQTMMMTWGLLKIISRLMKSQKTDIEEDTTQTADDVVFASVVSGALSEVCEVTAVMRELDDKENDLVKEFANQGCGCDFGPKKHHAPCASQWNTTSPSELPSLR